MRSQTLAGYHRLSDPSVGGTKTKLRKVAENSSQLLNTVLADDLCMAIKSNRREMIHFKVICYESFVHLAHVLRSAHYPTVDNAADMTIKSIFV